MDVWGPGMVVSATAYHVRVRRSLTALDMRVSKKQNVSFTFARKGYPYRAYE